MKKYRIKNYYNQGYIVQERTLIFVWYTFLENRLHGGYKLFSTIEEAKDYIKERKKRDIEIKKAKHIEYV